MLFNTYDYLLLYAVALLWMTLVVLFWLPMIPLFLVEPGIRDAFWQLLTYETCKCVYISVYKHLTHLYSISLLLGKSPELMTSLTICSVTNSV